LFTIAASAAATARFGEVAAEAALEKQGVLMDQIRSPHQRPEGPSRQAVLRGLLAAAAGAVGTTVLPPGTASATAREAAAPAVPAAPGRSPFPGDAAVATSPNRRIQIGLWLEQQGIRWAVTHDGVTVVQPSAAGLSLADGTSLGPGARVLRRAARGARGSWQPPYGRNAVVRDDYSERRIVLAAPGGIVFAVTVRAYDGGAALRHELVSAPHGTVTLAGELTQLELPAGTVVYGSRDEDPFLAVTPDAIPVTGGSGTDAGPLLDNPVTATLPGGALMCVCESDRRHYPRLMLSGGSGSALGVHLMQCAGRGGTLPPESTFTLPVPATTPWRVLVLGADGAELIDHSDLVTTLATPDTIGDTSWIKPGKVLRVTTLTTQAGLDAADFAAERGLRYIEFDSGWYGPEASPSSDPTKPIAALDLPTVIAHAKGLGIGVMLYLNQIALSNPDALFSLYQRWGIAGLKLGFILDGTQEQTDQVTGFAATAAKYHLLLNQHDDLRPFELL
jgi:alpha-glucosidase